MKKINNKTEMSRNNYSWNNLLLLITIILFLELSSLFAQTGNIDETDKWAWGTNIGWVDFHPQYGGVTVYYDHLEGYAWGENIGWIRLGTHTTGAPHTYQNNSYDNYGVNHDGSGNLSGFAWSPNVGWINFNHEYNPVTINMTTGSFDGYAWGENIGWIHFKNSMPEYNVVCTNPALPVELISFVVNVNENKVVLNWKTATEVDNYGFSIERASDYSSTPLNSRGEKEWVEIGFVQGHGNSSSPKEYSFVDNNPANGILHYRLKQIDNNGDFEYSEVERISFMESLPTEFVLEQNFPNPFNPTTKIKFSLPETGNVHLRVFNILGEETAELLNQEMKAGYHQIEFDGSHLSSGIYFYSINVDGKFNSTKKMLMMK